ncbi:hypothetical protein FDB61_17850 [Clostridium botulinum]|nr:hypothetical protein [Clostridium botulinum]
MKLNSKKEGRKLGDPKRNRNKKVILMNVGLVLSGVVLTTTVYQFGILPYSRNLERKQTIQELTDSTSEYVQAWKLTKELKQGDTIDIENDLKKVTVSSEGVPQDYIKDKKQIEGLALRLKLSNNTIISSDMLVDMEESVKDSTKNQDYDWIKVHSFAKQGDYVDIHYKKPDGSDYIVASKKKLINLSGSVFSTNLVDEEERAYINNATVAAAVSGGTLYTSLYPDPENQVAATVTYRLNDDIKRMIERDPEVLNKAKAQLKNSNSTAVKKNSNSNSDDTADNGSKPSFAE